MTAVLASRRLHPLVKVLISGVLLLPVTYTAFSQVAVETLKGFGVVELMGDDPDNILFVGSEGALYGTTYRGGTRGLGTLYRVSTNGADYKVLHHFGIGEDGQTPDAGLMVATDGNLY